MESALSSPTTPTNPLSTITEDKELQLNDAYKAYARRLIVESKQRPMSLPPIENGRETVDNKANDLVSVQNSYVSFCLHAIANIV